jgi:hypothetical protein
MQRPWALPLLSLVLCAGCRIHDLEDGTYTFTVTQVIRDECGLAGQQLLGPAGLVTNGNEVDLSFSTPDVRLSGIYKDGIQEMVLDGALTNYETLVRGQTCLLDSLTLHTDTVTLDPTDFSGTMSIVYDARTPDSCVCKVWFEYTAARTN